MKFSRNNEIKSLALLFSAVNANFRNEFWLEDPNRMITKKLSLPSLEIYSTAKICKFYIHFYTHWILQPTLNKFHSRENYQYSNFLIENRFCENYSIRKENLWKLEAAGWCFTVDPTKVSVNKLLNYRILHVLLLQFEIILWLFFTKYLELWKQIYITVATYYLNEKALCHLHRWSQFYLFLKVV